MINTLTEEEAKKKYCCQAIHMLGMKPIINCTAGACMAWRWQEESVILRKGVKVGGDRQPMGYCGLAGTPI